jgi:hypothetical protein
MNLREWVLPWLDLPEAIREGQAAAQQQADRSAIDGSEYAKETDVLLDETRRLLDGEDARRSGADTRATTYLALVGVLAPILAALAPAATDPGKDLARSVVSVILFAAAGGYLFGCGFWSFKALEVTRMGRIDFGDIIKAANAAAPSAYLIRTALKCVLFSRPHVNAKISCIKMAHAYGFRALIVSVAAMMLRLGWEPILKLLEKV